MRTFAAAVLLMVGWASEARSQSVVEGTVVGTDSVPVTAARVELTDSSGSLTLETVTDTIGAFRVPLARHVRPGLFYLSVSSLGYIGVQRRPVVIGRTERVVVSVTLAFTPIELQPVSVVARRRYRPDATDEFQDRAYWVKRTGMGRVLEYAELQRMHGANLPRALAHVAGVTLTTVNGVEAVRMRNCAPVIYLDRIRLDARDASFIQATELEGVEVYRSAAEAPAEYGIQAGDCGVILAWSNMRVEHGRVLTWKRAAVAAGLLLFLLTR